MPLAHMQRKRGTCCTAQPQLALSGQGSWPRRSSCCRHCCCNRWLALQGALLLPRLLAWLLLLLLPLLAWHALTQRIRSPAGPRRCCPLLLLLTPLLLLLLLLLGLLLLLRL